MAVRIVRSSSKRDRAGLPRHQVKRRFIPDGDSDFANKARNFASRLKEDPQRYAVSAEDAERVEQAVVRFREALAKSLNRFTRSMQMTRQKDDARVEAEKIVRKFGNLIRLNDQISAADKIRVGIHEKAKRSRNARKIVTAPYLRFLRTTGDDRSCEPMHILEFREDLNAGGRARPDGAVRIELFFEMVHPDAPIPNHPAEISGWPKYLGSYTRSPMRVAFPIPDQPMRVVYWAQWADAQGNVGPLCRAVKARVEGYENGGMALPRGNGSKQRQKIAITSAMKALPHAGPKIEAVSVGVARLLPAAMQVVNR